MGLQGVIGLLAQPQAVGAAACVLFHLGTQVVKQLHGVAVVVAELIELLAAGGGVGAHPLVAPYAALEKVLREHDVLVQVHLLGHKLHLGPPGVGHAGGVGAPIVQAGDLVDANDHLVHRAGIALVHLAHLRGLDLAELGLTLHVVPQQILLGEGVELGRGQLHRADGEDGLCHIAAGVLEIGHAQVGQVDVGLKGALCDLKLDALGCHSVH